VKQINISSVVFSIFGNTNIFTGQKKFLGDTLFYIITIKIYNI